MKTLGNLLATKEIEKIKHPAKAGIFLCQKTQRLTLLKIRTEALLTLLKSRPEALLTPYSFLLTLLNRQRFL